MMMDLLLPWRDLLSPVDKFIMMLLRCLLLPSSPFPIHEYWVESGWAVDRNWRQKNRWYYISMCRRTSRFMKAVDLDKLKVRYPSSLILNICSSTSLILNICSSTLQYSPASKPEAKRSKLYERGDSCRPIKYVPQSGGNMKTWFPPPLITGPK